MSTRAVYGFKDEHATHWVYVHHDGYPSGAADKFSTALKSKKCWQLPRFEADEFAAGFIAANKDRPGSVRLTSGPQAHGDIEYVYVLYYKTKNGPFGDAGPLYLRASYPTEDEKTIFDGLLTDFIANVNKIEEALAQ